LAAPDRDEPPIEVLAALQVILLVLEEEYMKKIIGVLHTTTATVDLLNRLAGEIIPSFSMLHYVDETILPQVAADRGDLVNVIERLVKHARCAEDMGADAVLNACSSVGEAVSTIKENVTVPVIRIDEGMAEEAVRAGRVVGVAATLETTLKPTVRLLEEKAATAGRDIQIETLLISEAFQRLSVGDRDGHDLLLSTSLCDLLEKVDIVVLAQASMTRVLTSYDPDTQKRFLSSPKLGMERLRKVLEVTYGTQHFSN
jgi:Asp/Glu/hydantoin racemase